jgi:hypothetical protein
VEAKKTAKTLLEELGIPVPKKIEDFVHIRKAVGKFLAASTFVSRNPLVVMDLPIQPGHDTKAMLRARVVCDERVTLNKSMFSHMPEVWDKISKTIPGNTVDVTVFYRCNTEVWWVAKVEDEAIRDSFVRKLWSSNPGTSGPENALTTESNVFMTQGEVPTQDNQMQGDEANLPPVSIDFVASVMGEPYYKKNKLGPKEDQHKWFWFKCECGLVMSAVSQWEVKVRQSCVTRGGYVCRHCAGMWKASRGGSRMLQLSGVTGKIQLVVDEPPEIEYNQWANDRIEYYKCVEPNAPIRDVAPDVTLPAAHRVRLRGLASEAVWKVVLTNPEKAGLQAINRLGRMHEQRRIEFVESSSSS